MRSLQRCLHLLTNNNEALDVALQALCLMQLAIRQKDAQLRDESLLMKGRALRSLRVSLSDPRSASSVETLAASMSLKSYEASFLNLVHD